MRCASISTVKLLIVVDACSFGEKGVPEGIVTESVDQGACPPQLDQFPGFVQFASTVPFHMQILACTFVDVNANVSVNTDTAIINENIQRDLLLKPFIVRFLLQVFDGPDNKIFPNGVDAKWQAIDYYPDYTLIYNIIQIYILFIISKKRHKVTTHWAMTVLKRALG